MTGHGPNSWDGRPLVIPAGGVLLGPVDAYLAAEAIQLVAKLQHVPLSQRARNVRDACRAARLNARSGQPDVRCEADLSASGPWVGVAQVVELLKPFGLGERQSRRLMTSDAFGSSRKVKGRWQVRRDAVESYVETRMREEQEHE
jgi:hypothetical protein